MNYEELRAQRCELAKSAELWQFDLLSPQKLWQFAKDRGAPGFGTNTVTDLWRAGIVRADLVASDCEVELPGLALVSQESNLHLYCDQRQVEHRTGGYGGILSELTPVPESLKLHFHPFRLYLLYHIDRVFGSSIASTQYLLNPAGFAKLSECQVKHLDDWTSSASCSERFEHWNRIAELAIVLEPIAYGDVFQAIRWRIWDTEESLRAKLKVRRREVGNLLSSLGAAEINEIRGELCRNAEFLDRNKLLHVLLRLMSRQHRLKLQDTLGGSMLFLCMAEIIRRASEDALNQDLPEEDELGFGQWMVGARKSIYGTERILDAPRETRRDFLTSMGLDYGVKVRCYVEGETEVGALASAVGEAGGTEFLNLRGQVVERLGRGLSFAASLKNDRKSHVFSVVVLDADREDNIRTLKKAAKDDTFFGRFFISSPDFEFANFAVCELVDVALSLAVREGDEAPARDEIMALAAASKSGKQFFEALKPSGLQTIAKSEAWGTALMNHALQQPKFPENHEKAGKVRPCIEIAQLLLQARDVGYLESLERLRVDPDTGELVEK